MSTSPLDFCWNDLLGGVAEPASSTIHCQAHLDRRDGVAMDPDAVVSLGRAPDTSCTRHVLTPSSSGGWCRVARKAEPDSFGGGLDAGLYAELFEDVRDVHAGSLGAHVKRRVAIGPPSHDQGKHLTLTFGQRWVWVCGGRGVLVVLGHGVVEMDPGDLRQIVYPAQQRCRAELLGDLPGRFELAGRAASVAGLPAVSQQRLSRPQPGLRLPVRPAE